MTTITSQELKDSEMIAQLNNMIENKKIRKLKIYNHGSLICILNPSELKVHVSFKAFFSLSLFHPYLQIMLLDNEFSSIEIIEAD